MNIFDFNPFTTIDYPEKSAAIIYFANCNYRCPACYSKQIIHGKDVKDFEDIFNHLKQNKNWLEGVVLCGGEPTLQDDISKVAKKIKGLELLVKLDTNGSRPEVIESLINEKIIDYVAMDVKGPQHLYKKVTGIPNLGFKKTEESMNVLSNSDIDYEFRTTIVPIILKKDGKTKTRWLSPKETGMMACWIYETTKTNKHKHYIQKFVAKSKKEMIDKMLSKEELAEEFHETPRGLLEKTVEQTRNFLPNSMIRGTKQV